MIGYPVSVAELKARVESFKPGWTARAAAKTELARRQGNFDGVGSIWAEIKPVFMRLQGDYKCAYCERKLEAEEYGAIEQDVEHFRPKNRVAVHPDQNAGGYFPAGGPDFQLCRRARARKVIDAAVSPASPHANCGRSFKRLFERAPDQAEVIFDAAVDFVASIS